MKQKKTEEKIVNTEELINEDTQKNEQVDEELEEVVEETEEVNDNDKKIEEPVEKVENKNDKETKSSEENQETQEEIESNSKQSETIFSKRIEIPLAWLILIVLIFIIIIISLIIFKDKIFGFNSNKLKDNNVYSNQLSGDNLLNEEEKIGFDIVSNWLENYKNTSIEITSKILSYNINSISLNSKKDDKFIIMATYDVVPASIDNTIWINDNGERQGNTIKNKSRVFYYRKSK